MALYLGSSEINPIETKEVIKEVPTEQDLTLMGNELRRAYCWKHSELVTNQWKLYNPYTNIYSDIFEASSISGLKYNNTANYTYPQSSYIIIDGKLYSLSLTSNYITMTQLGTNTDWQDTNGSIFIRNNKAYNSYSDANNNVNAIVTGTNFIVSDYGQGNYYFIADGNLYYYSTLLDSGGWQYIYNWLGSTYYSVGLKNNKIYYINATKGVKYSSIDYTITNINLLGFGASYFCYAIENKLYGNKFNYNDGAIYSTIIYEFDNNIKKITTGYGTGVSDGSCIVLLENGNLYSVSLSEIQTSTNPKLKAQNIKENINFCSTYFLSNDNKVYNIDGTIVGNNFSGNILNKGYFFSPIFFEETDYNTYVYTIQYENNITKAYNTVNLPVLEYDTSNVNSFSLTAQNKVYLRDGTNDSVFTFFPEDLENHTFTDTDLLQAYLDAGVRQQQNT